MLAKTYPVGTQIKYIGYCDRCKGQIGKIVKGVDKYTCTITLPQSTCSAVVNGNGKIACPWSDVIPISIKHEQLVFEFMYND